MHISILFVVFGLWFHCTAEQCDWIVTTNNDRITQCRENCFYRRERKKVDGTGLCEEGAITEDVNSCLAPPSLCLNSEPIFMKVREPCRGNCDRSLERVMLSCKNRPDCKIFQTRYCTNLTTCKGEWSQWSEYNKCNATTNGYKKRERRCLNKETGQYTGYCAGSRGNWRESQVSPCSTACNRSSADVPNCRCLCHSLGHGFSVEQVYKKCEVAMAKRDFQGQSCDFIGGFVMSCDRVAEERLCAVADNSWFCKNYFPWSEWIEWRTKDDWKSRRRHRWCLNPLPYFSKSFPCQNPLEIQQQCSDTDPAPASTNYIIWLILMGIGLFIAIAVIVVMLFWCKRNRKKKADIRNPEKGKDISRENLAQNKQQNEKLQRSLLSPLRNVQEQMYEAISLKDLKLLSPFRRNKSPTMQTRNHKDERKIEKKSQKSNRLTPSGGKSHPLRISVTVTDPEGIQVDKNTFKPKIKSSNKNGGKETNKAENLHRSRWSRVPTPEPTSKSEFFVPSPEKNIISDHLRAADNIIRSSAPSLLNLTSVRVKSVQYGNQKASSQHLLSSCVDSMRLPSTSKELHHYDAVASNRQSCLRSAHSSVTLDGDDLSLWSQNSFEDENDYRKEMAQVSVKEPKQQSGRGIVAKTNHSTQPHFFGHRVLHAVSNQSEKVNPLLLSPGNQYIQPPSLAKYIDMKHFPNNHQNISSKELHRLSNEETFVNSAEENRYVVPTTTINHLQHQLPTDNFGYFQP